jgi:hypothetical protein
MQQPRIDSAFSRSRGSSTLYATRPMERHVEEAEPTPIHEDPSPAMDRRYRSQLQPPRSNMDWPDWAVRSMRVQERLASTLEQIIWGSIGALSGTALAGLPVLFESVRSGYPFVLYQPLGAAVGATLAVSVMAIVGRGRRAEREALQRPSSWSVR